MSTNFRIASKYVHVQTSHRQGLITGENYFFLSYRYPAICGDCIVDKTDKSIVTEKYTAAGTMYSIRMYGLQVQLQVHSKVTRRTIFFFDDLRNELKK